MRLFSPTKLLNIHSSFIHTALTKKSGPKEVAEVETPTSKPEARAMRFADEIQVENVVPIPVLLPAGVPENDVMRELRMFEKMAELALSSELEEEKVQVPLTVTVPRFLDVVLEEADLDLTPRLTEETTEVGKGVAVVEVLTVAEPPVVETNVEFSIPEGALEEAEEASEAVAGVTEVVTEPVVEVAVVETQDVLPEQAVSESVVELVVETAEEETLSEPMVEMAVESQDLAVEEQVVSEPVVETQDVVDEEEQVVLEPVVEVAVEAEEVLSIPNKLEESVVESVVEVQDEVAEPTMIAVEVEAPVVRVEMIETEKEETESAVVVAAEEEAQANSEVQEVVVAPMPTEVIVEVARKQESLPESEPAVAMAKQDSIVTAEAVAEMEDLLTTIRKVEQYLSAATVEAQKKGVKENRKASAFAGAKREMMPTSVATSARTEVKQCRASRPVQESVRKLEAASFRKLESARPGVPAPTSVAARVQVINTKVMKEEVYLLTFFCMILYLVGNKIFVKG